MGYFSSVFSLYSIGVGNRIKWNYPSENSVDTLLFRATYISLVFTHQNPEFSILAQILDFSHNFTIEMLRSGDMLYLKRTFYYFWRAI